MNLRSTHSSGRLDLIVWFACLVTLPFAGGTAADSPWADYVEPDFPFFSSVLDARTLGDGWPDDNLTPRGLILDLGHDAWACFDIDLLRVAAMWTGDAVTPVSMSQGSYHVSGLKAPAGQGKLPQPAGTVWLANGLYPGWQTGSEISFTDPRAPGPDPRELGRGPLPFDQGRFRAVRQTRGGVIIEYEVSGTRIEEMISARRIDGKTVMQRSFRVPPHDETFWLVVGKRPEPVQASPLVTLVAGDSALGELVDQPAGCHAVKLPPCATASSFHVVFGAEDHPDAWGMRAQGDAMRPPEKRWPETVTARATLAGDDEAFVVDNVSLPNGNPWRRNVRLADVAFFQDGRAAAVSYDGDVWMIAGLSGDLQSVAWKRYASGFHEPLSLCVRDEDLFVNDRNGIWRLRDTDGNGEADLHELFSHAFTQTAETREFATGIEVAPDGSFIISKGGQQSSTLGTHNGTVLRVAANGEHAEVLGWGLRMPFIGVHPVTGLITASDQQGHHVPTTPLHIIRGHRYYGFLTGLEKDKGYPDTIAEPLTWIPHPVNPSGVSQVWLTGARMGALNDALIHLAYYRPEIFVVRWNERTARPQAAVMSLTRHLAFPLLNGGVHPVSGQLYVTGFQIWGSEASQISGLARVRPTGRPFTFPREIVPMDQGVLLRFDVALDSSSADPSNFSAERWEYRRTASYGSPHFKPGGGKGQEPMAPSSAYLSRDGRGVFVGIPDMKPVMQFRIGWSLRTREGQAFAHSAYTTPYELARFDPAAEGFDSFQVDLTPRALAATEDIPITAEEGRRVTELMGCVACHSTDGSTLGKVGPSWKGLFGSRRSFAGGGQARADEDYLRESIRDPAARVVKGFESTDTGMPSYDGVITDAQIEAVILYLKNLR